MGSRITKSTRNQSKRKEMTGKVPQKDMLCHFLSLKAFFPSDYQRTKYFTAPKCYRYLVLARRPPFGNRFTVGFLRFQSFGDNFFVVVEGRPVYQLHKKLREWGFQCEAHCHFISCLFLPTGGGELSQPCTQQKWVISAEFYVFSSISGSKRPIVVVLNPTSS